MGEVVTLTASLSVAIGVVAATANQSFLEVWTKSRAAWASQVDILLALLLFIACVSRCLTGISGVVKQLKVMRFIYFLEGLTFVCLAALGAKAFGFSGVAVAAIVAMLGWSGTSGVRLVQRLFGCGWREMAGWVLPSFRLALILIPTAFLGRWLVAGAPAAIRLVLLSGILGVIATALTWSVGLPRPFRAEIVTRLSTRFH